MESKHKQQHAVCEYLFFIIPFLSSPLFLHYFSHLSEDRFNTATPTLNPEHTSACQVYAHKSSGSKEEGGLHFGLTVVYSL